MATPPLDAMYCELCEMWLNGQGQLEDHKMGKKHRKKAHRRKKTDISLRSMGVCIARKWLREKAYRDAQTHIVIALCLARKLLGQRSEAQDSPRSA